MTIEELDGVLKNINESASIYEALVLAPIKNGMLTYGEFVNYVKQEFSRLGGSLGTQIMEYIYAIIWCSSNTSTNEGDIIKIDVGKHTQKGKELVSKNLDLIGMYVFPLLLYGAEYSAESYTSLNKDMLEPILKGYVPNLDLEVSFPSFMNHLLESALQARFYQLRECYIQYDMGNKEYIKRDF